MLFFRRIYKALNETPTKGHIMFLKNREFRIRVAKPVEGDENATETADSIFDPEKIAQISKDVVKHVAVGVGAIIVVSAAVGTIREVIVKKTKSADEE